MKASFAGLIGWNIGLSQTYEIHCRPISVQSTKLLTLPRNKQWRHEELTVWHRYLSSLNGLEPQQKAAAAANDGSSGTIREALS